MPRWTDNLNDRALEQRPGHPHVVIFRDAIDHGIGFVNILPMVGTILVVQTRGVEKLNAIAFSDPLAGSALEEILCTRQHPPVFTVIHLRPPLLIGSSAFKG